MKKKKGKIGFFTIFFFIFGLVLYLGGLFLLFGSSIGKLSYVQKYIKYLPSLVSSSTGNVKIYGLILFLVGFFLFMISVVFLYKNNKFQEDNKNLIIEGKADIITIIVMTYVLIFMLVICLVFDELIGALLFGISIVFQSILNSALISYYNKR